ncbi:hypothetical protein DXG01_004899 [Tephrocybe rancida]|nr:hypothetical protein DXG01_004899 [Tephrocybe rancida]
MPPLDVVSTAITGGSLAVILIQYTQALRIEAAREGPTRLKSAEDHVKRAMDDLRSFSPYIKEDFHDLQYSRCTTLLIAVQDLLNENSKSGLFRKYWNATNFNEQAMNLDIMCREVAYYVHEESTAAKRKKERGNTSTVPEAVAEISPPSAALGVIQETTLTSATPKIKEFEEPAPLDITDEPTTPGPEACMITRGSLSIKSEADTTNSSPHEGNSYAMRNLGRVENRSDCTSASDSVYMA